MLRGLNKSISSENFGKFPLKALAVKSACHDI